MSLNEWLDEPVEPEVERLARQQSQGLEEHLAQGTGHSPRVLGPEDQTWRAFVPEVREALKILKGC